MDFLYSKFDVLREYGGIAKFPDYVAENLNKKFELRDYQKKAFENFITYFEKNPPHPTQVLFHMATGSGKTLMMAGLIIYLYKQGYRNFLFFVNLTNILEKTRDNFLNSTSSKYLFADEIIIDGEKIRMNEVENFQYADKDAINICFVTTQKLHMDIFFVKENGMSFDDFDERKTVFISDEAHHLNVDTRKLNRTESESHNSWESTVRNIFERNSENILLEFTATCNLADENIKKFYTDKIIFNYPLKNFYDDKYSKEIMTLRSNFSPMEKVLQALVLSQYRLKIFQNNRLSIKPVILFKSATIEENKKFLSDFIEQIKNLDGNYLRELSKKCENEIMQRAFEYFSKDNISFDMLAAELKDDFSESHCISANNNDDACKNQLIFNSLEDADNPYRAIFEVKKLDEGWDVLNLFDIVRLYETRQSGGKKISPATVAEAQLIGRGARYCPFQTEENQPKFQRKFDKDATCDLRICETLYYHCQNDPRYILELRTALKEIGLKADRELVPVKYILKDSFKKDDLYREGFIFLNYRIIQDRQTIQKIPDSVKNNIYKIQAVAGISESDKIMSENQNGGEKIIKHHLERLTINEIAKMNYAIVNKAMLKHPIYKFNVLKKFFPNLKSSRQFITDKNYLGDVRIDINIQDSKSSPKILYDAVLEVLGDIGTKISQTGTKYKGTKEFYAENISKIFDDKIVTYSETHGGGIGISQNDLSAEDLRIDLSSEDWFAYTDNFGTSEEKEFVAYFKDYVEELKKNYSKIYLIRNERAFHIYSFDDGERFEPDYVLFLQKKEEDKFEQLQIFIEPKGTHLLEKDAWKEKFLLQLKSNSVPVKKFVDNDRYKILGVHFFNRDTRLKIFEEDFKTLAD